MIFLIRNVSAFLILFFFGFYTTMILSPNFDIIYGYFIQTCFCKNVHFISIQTFITFMNKLGFLTVVKCAYRQGLLQCSKKTCIIYFDNG